MATTTRSTISIMMSQFIEEEPDDDQGQNDPNERLRDIIREVDRTRDELRAVRENILGVSRSMADVKQIDKDGDEKFERVKEGHTESTIVNKVTPPLSCPYLQWMLPLHRYVTSSVPSSGTQPLDEDDAIARDHLREYSKATTAEDIRRADLTAMKRLKNDFVTNFNWHSIILLLHVTAKYLWDSVFGVNFTQKINNEKTSPILCDKEKCARKISPFPDPPSVEVQPGGNGGQSYFTPQFSSTPVDNNTRTRFNFSPTRMGTPVSPVSLQGQIENLSRRVDELECLEESMTRGPPPTPRMTKFMAKRLQRKC